MSNVSTLIHANMRNAYIEADINIITQEKEYRTWGSHMSEIARRILGEITRIEGVRAAIVVSRDGLVLDAVIPRRDINAEDIAVAIMQIFNAADKLGKDFGLGSSDITSVEYTNGIIMIGSMGENVLAVVAERGAMLGMIRNEIKKQKERLRAAI